MAEQQRGLCSADRVVDQRVRLVQVDRGLAADVRLGRAELEKQVGALCVWGGSASARRR